MASLCPDQPESDVRTESGNGANIVDQFQFAQFIQKTMLKLLAFADVIDTLDAKQITLEEQDLRNWMVPRQQYDHLHTLLSVHGALSSALDKIRLSFPSPSSAQVERIQGEIVSLLSSEEAKVAEAIWSTMQQIRTESIEDDDGSFTSLNPQESSNIHKTTQSVVTYIRILQCHCRHVAAIVSEATKPGKYVPQIGNLQPLNSMIIEMVSRLQEKLANISESYSDQCLRFLFLLNNSYLIIKQKLHYESDSSLQVHVAALVSKVEMYMESYLQLSWDPVLSCLLNPTPLCYGRSSPLTKFESAFQKTYSRQKLWKVPDPELRKRLRKAITNKIIYGYTRYIDDNNITTPKFTTQELQELFEG
ncbi:unnamed protein product [Miscanthus lutarioriparius]|uniref:Exocyst subunit Exo70 family protein n=1 Tax=Miscanthus lutarioriparius TaxID=422564 RepID=A0A811S6V1_9POAL|nr:unnamed protein product [Miscanthus lutarioriparius]